MSYAGPSRTQSARTSDAEVRTSTIAPPSSPRRLPEPLQDTDWRQLAVFGAGLALGIALGAGAAMLTAPQSGAETRADIRRVVARKRRAIGRRSNDAWQDLRSELRSARQAFRRRKALRAADREAEDYV
jgi:hypothetical protein